jgi:hypothetical protein
MEPHAIPALIHNRVFYTDTLFIRTEDTVGAQSAQWLLLACEGNWDAAETPA